MRRLRGSEVLQVRQAGAQIWRALLRAVQKVYQQNGQVAGVRQVNEQSVASAAVQEGRWAVHRATGGEESTVEFHEVHVQVALSGLLAENLPKVLQHTGRLEAAVDVSASTLHQGFHVDAI